MTGVNKKNTDRFVSAWKKVYIFAHFIRIGIDNRIFEKFLNKTIAKFIIEEKHENNN